MRDPALPSSARNVFGAPLACCCTSPRAGFHRDGYSHTGPHDLGSHTVCAQMTAEFLEFSRGRGNDLVTPRPEFDFPGLAPWFVRDGDQRPRLVNMYGITETTVHVTYRALDQDVTGVTRSPVGRALAGWQFYILDDHLNPVPPEATSNRWSGPSAKAILPPSLPASPPWKENACGNSGATNRPPRSARRTGR